MEDLVACIRSTKDKKQVVRVAGSVHSASMGIYTKDGGKPLLLTGKFRECTHTEKDGVLYFKAGGGCYLGYNPMDPASKPATWEDSVCYKVQEAGYAFTVLGGIIQQSVGGFIMTGSAGGSLDHCFTDAIHEIEFVDGTGTRHTATRDDENTDLFYAVGVSLGLFGVITSVTFRLENKRFYVAGKNVNVEFKDSFLKDGPTLEKSLKDNEYFRVNWLPQKYVNRAMQWTAKHADPPSPGRPYKPYVDILSKPLMAIGAWLALEIIDCILQKPDPLNDLWLRLIGYILSEFVPVPDVHPVTFLDWWYHALPMDNEVPVDTIIKIDFTQIWLPMDKCQEMLDGLKSLFKDPKAAGNFATEIYGAKSSKFWLSMSHGGNRVRVDPYWFHWNRNKHGQMHKYFTGFWDKLLRLDARLHWGKWLPEPGQVCGGVTFNLEHLKNSYPKLEDWLKMRETYDPDQVFITNYWRGILEIPEPKTTS